MWTQGSCSNVLRQQDENISNLTTVDVPHATLFGRLSMSQSVLVQSYRSITESILTSSITVWYGSASCRSKGSVLFKPLRGLWSPGCTTSHTHLHNNRAGKKAKKISADPANWDSHLFDPFSLLKSPLTTTVSSQGHSSFQTPRVKMKRLMTFHALDIYIKAPGQWFELYLDISEDDDFQHFKLIKTQTI